MNDEHLNVVPGITFLGIPVQHRPRCASTMDIVAVLADEGAPDGTCVITDEQTAGRGRAGRAWVAPPGTCILLSTLLKPDVASERLGQLSILLALAVARLVEKHASRPVKIKWPNDVLVDDAKISGVLANVRIPVDGNPNVIVGIGLNVNISPDSLLPGATSLRALTGQPCSRESVLRDFLAGLETVYRAFMVGGIDELWDDANARLAYRDEVVTITEGDSVIAGTVLGLAPAGALRLLLPDGKEREIWSGDLMRGPRPVSARALPQ